MVATKKTTAGKEKPKKNLVKKSVETIRDNIREEFILDEQEQKKNILSVLKNRRAIIIFAILFLAVALIYSLRSVFIVAMVNGQPIYRYEVIKELEKQGGKQVVDSLVTKNLVIQEAKKKNITVSDSEVEAELKKVDDNLKKQGQSLDQALLTQGVSKEDFIQQIKLQKMVEKMVSSDVKVSDEEINQYIEQNKDFLPKDQSEEDLKKQVKSQIQQQKMNGKLQEWVQDLQKKAKINYLVNY